MPDTSDVFKEKPKPYWVRWLKWLFYIAVLAGIVASLVTGWQDIRAFAWRIYPPLILLAFWLYMFFFIGRGIVWVQTARLLRAQVSWSSGLRLYINTYTARYIPGGVWTLVTVATMGQAEGISKRISVFILFFNVGLLVTVDTLYLTPFVYGLGGLSLVLLFVIATAALMAFLPTILRRALPLLARAKILPSNVDSTAITQRQKVYRLLLGTMAHQTVQIIAYFAFIVGMMQITSAEALYLTFAYAVAWLVGLLILFVPQGLGVREGVFVLLGTPLLTPQIAVALSVALRLLTVVSDLIMLGFAIFLDRYTKKKAISA
jgi:uncharacterized membrane protein YbhN (UPF0104 family)